MEPDKEVMSRLKFIGKVQKGEKINVKYMFIQPEGIITRISRTIINQDCRENTLNFVRNTITSTFQIINIYSSSTKDSQKHICLNIIQDLKHSTKGITNLKNTYRDDVKLDYIGHSAQNYKVGLRQISKVVREELQYMA